MARECLQEPGDSFRTGTYSQYVEVVFITAGCYPLKHGLESSQIQIVSSYSACNPTSLDNIVRKPSRIREKASIMGRSETERWKRKIQSCAGGDLVCAMAELGIDRFFSRAQIWLDLLLKD